MARGSGWRGVAVVLVVLLLLGVTAYALGLLAASRRSALARRRATLRGPCFAAGSLALAIALFSPIDRVAESLFSVHMVQHLLLVVVAAPLLVLGDPLVTMLWSLPLRARRACARGWREAVVLRSMWRFLRRPVVAWTLHVGTLWLWHLPRLYDRAVERESIHVVEHVTFLLTALLFWWVVLQPRRGRIGVGLASICLFAAALQCTLLGTALALSRRPWYTSHLATTAAWGLSPLEDQQLAGLIMWIPAGLVYLTALMFVLLPVLRGRAHAPVARWRASVAARRA